MRLTILLFVLMAPVLLFSQENEYQDFYDGAYVTAAPVRKPKTRTFNICNVIQKYSLTGISKKELDQIPTEQLELEFMRYCSYKHFKQRRIAYGLSVGSFAMAGVAAYAVERDQTLLNPSLYGVGAFSLAALVVFIDADKWLRYSSIKPSREGVGITITF